MTDLVEINLHGTLGEVIGNFWRLNVCSVAEAMNAIDVLSKGKLFPYLAKKENQKAKFQVLINQSPIVSDNIDYDNLESIRYSELTINRDIKTIDIVPVIEGADLFDVLGIVLGVALIAIGIFAPVSLPVAASFVVGGLGLVAGGVIGLLTSTPKFGDFEDFKSNNAQSYLFNGPVNTIREGGPIPVGYGRLLVGSQVISTSRVIDEAINTDVLESNQVGTPNNPFEAEQSGFYMISDLEGTIRGINPAVSAVFKIYQPNGEIVKGDIDWSISEGAVPPGTTFAEYQDGSFGNTTFAKLTGTINTQGAYTFTVKANFQYGELSSVVTKTYNILNRL